jgi:flagellar basal-body rod modification protein FlgD
MEALMTVSGVTGTTGTTKTSTSVDRTAMDKDTFLKLLVAQMKYQDPSSPTDPTQFLTETAQFTVVDKLSDISTYTQRQTASSLIGQTVTYLDSSGAKATGSVTGATLNANPPTVTIGGEAWGLDSIIGVGELPAARNADGSSGSTS